MDWAAIPHAGRVSSPWAKGCSGLSREGVQYIFSGQQGALCGAPIRSVPGGLSVDGVAVEEPAFPLCAAGANVEVAWNQGYAPAGQAVPEFEGKHGTAPEGGPCAAAGARAGPARPPPWIRMRGARPIRLADGEP